MTTNHVLKFAKTLELMKIQKRKKTFFHHFPQQYAMDHFIYLQAKFNIKQNIRYMI